MDVQAKLGEVVDLIEDIDDWDGSCHLIVAREEEDDEDNGSTEYVFKRAKTKDGLHHQLGEFAEERIGNKRDALEGDSKEATDYAASNITDQKELVQHVSSDDVPKFEQYENLVETDDFTATNYISEDGDEPEFQVIVLRDGTDERALVFQDITRREILGKDGNIRFWEHDEYYEEVEETIIEVPNRVDAVYYDEEIFIFDQRRFEKIFDYMDEFHSAAEDTAETIMDSDVPVHTGDVFLEAVKSYPNASRMFYAVQERALWEHDEVDMDMFDYIIDEYDLSVEIEERDGERGLVLQDKRNVWEIIHLYNDDHLNSPITEVAYQVKNKDPRSDGDGDSD